MRSAITQILLVLVLSFSSRVCVPQDPKTKRSPLEVGLVSFAPFAPMNHFIPKNTTYETVKNENKLVHTHRWVPGHVKQHAYIPAHLAHLYLPTHTVLVASAVETVFVQPEIYQPYRSHYGGFGLGVDVGGSGAGHGFHVIFNL